MQQKLAWFIVLKVYERYGYEDAAL